MPLIQYEGKRFRAATMDLINHANIIIEEYAQQGFTLTLRQLYYQFVSRDLIPNNDKMYKKLGRVINDARMAGLVDWSAIEDRGRWVRSRSSWADPAEIVDACVKSFHMNRWENQKYRPEVWIEKDALVGVIEGVCNDLDLPFMACRGYMSQSEQWTAGRRFRAARLNGQIPVVLHLGDHDPSGIDMTRDNQSRLSIFAQHNVDVRRLALNMDQVEEYDPPPNPTKLTDTRSDGYIEEFGHSCWELDALEPSAISELIKTNAEGLIDQPEWDAVVSQENAGKERLRELAQELGHE
jgi:hypothetical protein